MPDSTQTTYDYSLSGVSVPSLWTTDQLTNGPYEEVLVASRLITHMGMLPVPVAGPAGTPPELLEMHAPLQLRVVAWIVQRWGDRPQLPHPSTGNPAEILIYHDITVGSPVVQQFATAWQRVSGFYVYLLINPCNPSIDGVPGATNLASVIPASICNAEGYQFLRGVISPANFNPQGFTTTTDDGYVVSSGGN